MIPDVNGLGAVFPTGEKADAKAIAAKMQGMFLETMLKTMEESIEAEDGLFGKSASSEIYRGMLREHLSAAMSTQLQSPFERQFEQGIENQIIAKPEPARAKPKGMPEAPNKMTPVDGRVSSPVGWRRDPITGEQRFHKGTDIAAAYGTEVTAVADGVVVESRSKGGYGNAVVIKTDDGRTMLYGHNQANLVRAGDRVRRGDVIAQVGATGRATGPHVHFEVTE
jgi:murein DD-endopeptidase MepM/ murein hydrolase activator NlpD